MTCFWRACKCFILLYEGYSEPFDADEHSGNLGSSTNRLLGSRTFVDNEDDFNNAVSASQGNLGFGIYAPSADSATFYHSADYSVAGMFALLLPTEQSLTRLL